MASKNSVVANQYGFALNISSPMVAHSGFGAAKALLKEALIEGMIAQVSPFQFADKFLSGRYRDNVVAEIQRHTRLKAVNPSTSSIMKYAAAIPKQKKTKGHVSAPAYLNSMQIVNVAKAINTNVLLISGMLKHSLFLESMSGTCGRDCRPCRTSIYRNVTQ